MAAENQQNPGIKNNIFIKGMNKDSADIFMSDQAYSHAINAINNAHTGETGTISNEPANEYYLSTPYTIINATHKTKNEWVICCTNDSESEIGIFNEASNTYTTVVNDRCLGFKKTHLITGVCKENYDCTFSFYFQDNLNPDRVLNLDKIPYQQIGEDVNGDCITPIYSESLDCDALRLHPLITQPCVTIKKGLGGGQFQNGSYMAVVAYSENGIRLTDYSLPSQPQGLWSHTGVGGSLEINIDSLDQDFEEYELVLIGVINQQAVARKIGNYSIRQNTVTLDIFSAALPVVDLSEIPLQKSIYEKSEKMFAVNGYLIRSSVTSQPFINYQPQANNIISEWVVAEYPSNHYWLGGNTVGYMRDEVYPFFIRWVYKTGSRSASYHIPGRAANSNDTEPVETKDVLEGEQYRWQVYDTSTSTLVSSGEVLPDGGVVVAKGSMGYWESTEKYPDDQPNVWGDFCGKSIRHHKMPSNETTHIHNQGGTKINVLGVQFSNIEHPLDENGDPIVDVVGYEILRGSRDGNKTIIAKGLFNNMNAYDINGVSPTITKGLFQNYPYNDLRSDPFLTPNYDTLDNNTLPSYYLQGANFLNYSFHSPDTNFTRPYLGSNYIKIYTEESGKVKGNFELPHKHPKTKLLTNKAFTTAFAIGLGISVVNAIGDVAGEASRSVGVLSQKTSVGTGQATGVFRVSASMLNQAASLVTLGAFGLITAYASTVVFTIAQIAYFGALGADQVLRTIYNFTKFRDHMIQYNSHGFYSDYRPVLNGETGSSPSCYRRTTQLNGVKYIGSGIQDVSSTFRVNNLYRNKFVLVTLKLEDLNNGKSIPRPYIQDDTRRKVTDIPTLDHGKPFKSGIAFQSNTSSYYGAIKVDFENQYGQLQSIIQLPTGSCVYNSNPQPGKLISSTGVIFGGDTYINRYTEKNPYYFFNTWLSGEQDGYEFDYRNYINGPCPRYWINLDQYDMGDFDITSNDQSGGSFAGRVIRKIMNLNFVTPTDFYRLDMPNTGATGKFVVKKGWAYLFYNGVRDFFVESEINLAYRDYGEQDTEKFYDPYGESFSDLSRMFRSDLITKPIMYKYDLSLSTARLFTNFATWGSILPRDYDPTLYSSCFEYYPKRVVYSLQQQSGLKRDNWKNFLPLNYKDFNSKVTSIKSLNAQGAVILFENSEPIQFIGVDKLETKNGGKFLIGDGGLFAENNMQGIVNADDTLNYGSSISSKSAVNTPFGLFWISQKTGKLMQHGGGGLKEISKNGLKFWINQNLPSKLLQQYPDFPLYDNPVVGIGCQTVYDQQYELVYFSKKDYLAKRTDLMFDDVSGVPYYECGTVPPTPITPQELDVHAVPSSTVSPNCIIDIVIAVDTSGSTAGPNAPIGNAERQFVKQFLENPDIVAAMQDGDIQVGLVSWSNQATSMNPDGFSMSSGLTGIQAYNWLANNWYNSGTSITPSLAFSQNVLNNKVNSEQGDRSSQPGFKQIIIFVTDTTTPPSNSVGCVYQSSTLGGGTSGPANQYLYAVYAGATSATPSYPSVLSYISCNKPAYEFGVAGNSASSISNVASAIAGASCAPPQVCNFESTEYDIIEGQQVILTWNMPNAVSATLNGDSVPVSGYAYALPLTSPFTTYTLVTTDVKGNVKTCNLKVNVTVRPSTVKKCFCPFDDNRCFEPASWTLSYDPKTETFVSFHDWVPELNIPSYDHFFTIKDNSIWKHNSRHDLFNNYYGVSRPWEIEIPVVNVGNVTTLRSVEFTMEGYKYFNDGLDFNHVLDATFDSAIIHNSEQNSGILKLKMKDKNNPFELIQQPNITPFYTEILVAKEENKYRFNQFWDNTDDRGEFSLDQTPMWVTSENGYTRAINPLYINYNKPPLQRKKFRHYGNKIVLRKTLSTDVKMILKLGSTKHLNSPR